MRAILHEWRFLLLFFLHADALMHAEIAPSSANMVMHAGGRYARQRRGTIFGQPFVIVRARTCAAAARTATTTTTTMPPTTGTV